MGEVRKLGKPVLTRKIEYETRPAVLEKLSSRIQHSNILDLYTQNSPDYDHINKEKTGDICVSTRLQL